MRKILVAVKKVVDYNTRIRVKPDGSGVALEGVKMSLNPFDEIALEEALRIRERGQAAEVIAVSVGPDDVQQHLRTALAMGADRAVLVKTDAVIEPLVAMNFEGAEDLYPEIVWQDYGEFEGIKVADTIRLLHAAGIVDMDQTDVNYARSVLGLPLRGEDDPPDEVVRPQPLPPPADPNKPPPAADQGNRRSEKGPGGARKTQPGTTKPTTAAADLSDVDSFSADEGVVRAFLQAFADMKAEIETLKAREPNQITVNPTVNVAAPPAPVAAAAPNVTVNVPEQPVTVNVATPEVKVDLAAPNVHVDGATVNLPGQKNVRKTFEYDAAGNIVASTETEL